MRLLLDTQIFLWSILDDPKLPRGARDILLDRQMEQVVSVVSIWEISIKHARHGRSAMPLSGGSALRYLEKGSLTALSVTSRHAAAVDHLPLIHGDPFDRMLVAQALTEPLRLLTSDATLARYSDTVILV